VATKSASLPGKVIVATMLAGRKLADERFRERGGAVAPAEMPITGSEARGLAPTVVESSSEDVIDVVATLMLTGAQQRWTELRVQ
jgi:hypothetical protein